ncbi:1-aminocyclopropane-1-carboxylate deaminase/D-cysteine desulfhydrase [Glaciecola sp. SC05]|uniref:1-aminocyclopropane-1-carboxylate deaminase/D-cysteine desulfhydrase n=1 Tax=Glaciecola sp. SC05 TaxID=1987355 RepID=UPI003528BCC9
MTLPELLKIRTPSPLHQIEIAPHKEVWCKRDDLLHPIISGNKWRKLRPILEQARTSQVKHIASFGGAYSNHLHALGFCCKTMNIPFTAVIRAHPNSPLTPMLIDLKAWGASLAFVSRVEYQQRHDISYQAHLKTSQKIDLLIPEGGSDARSLEGVADIIDEVCAEQTQPFDLIVLPVASGGTMAGLIKCIAERGLPSKVLGIAVLKGEGYLEGILDDLLAPHKKQTALDYTNWSIAHDADFHGGGYAKMTMAHKEFKEQFLHEHGFDLDCIYNTKSFFALRQLMIKNKLSEFPRILILHTGGLQGDR